MKFITKGNYFQNNFYQPPTTGLDSSYAIIEKINPSNHDEKLWESPIDSRHIGPAIESAQIGFNNWKKLTVSERINTLTGVIKKIEERLIEMATVISLETGRPLWETQLEVKQAITNIKKSLQSNSEKMAPTLLDTKELENIRVAQVKHLPTGITLVVASFCMPFLIPTGQIFNTLLAGNSVILKPSHRTCYTSQLIMECFHSQNIPLGVVNCINGKDEITRRLLKERSIRNIFFTGSKEIGLKILQTTNQDLGKIVSLNLSTKNTSIIHKDCNLDYTLNELLISSFMSSGQNCTSTSLVAIHKDILDKFITKFHNLAKQIIIDHPTNYEMEPFMGPLIDQQAVDNFILLVGMAKREGIEEIMRGKQIDKQFRGNYVTPSINLAKSLNEDSHFLTSEILAPNCTFIPYDDIDDAITIANNSEFGLVSSIYTQDKMITDKCLENINCGIININIPTTTINYSLPNKGIKNSGNHRSSGINSINENIYPLSYIERDSKSLKASELIGINKK